jgi:hypothetical protein
MKKYITLLLAITCVSCVQQTEPIYTEKFYYKLKDGRVVRALEVKDGLNTHYVYFMEIPNPNKK